LIQTIACVVNALIILKGMSAAFCFAMMDIRYKKSEILRFIAV
jgi:hypothetical protein